MSYESRKSMREQEFVEEIEIFCDACKYSIAPFDTTKNLTTSTHSNSYTGAVTVSSTGWSTTWATAGQIYLRNGSEIISATCTSGVDNSITIVARALFGTSAEAITGSMTLMHSGEADGSCRGFPHDCTTPGSYSSSAKKSLKFCTAQRGSGYIGFPGLRHGSINYDSGEVDVGESIGARSRLRFTIADQVHDGKYIVPYPDKRSSSGTLFGKLLACHPYFAGREVIYRSGFRDAGTFDEPAFIERKFIFDDVKLSGNKFSASCLDPLSLTEDKKAKMPVASPAILSAAIDTSLTAFSFIDAPNYYFGPNSSTVYVRIDSEILICTVTGATQLTPITRGYKSDAKAHDAGASIQDCIRFNGTHGIDAIEFAISNYTSIPASFLDDYSAVKALTPSFELDDAIIEKPTSVVDFINSLVKIGNLIMGYNDVTQKIVINYIPELSVEPVLISESQHIKRDSVSIDQNVRNQYTRFQVLWGRVDATKDSEENYAIRYMPVNIGLESDENLGQANEKPPFKTPLLNNSTGDSLQAISYASRVIERNSSPPKIAQFTIDAAFYGDFSGGNVAPGSVINLQTKENQDKDGNSLSETFQVVKASGNEYEGIKVKAIRYQFVEPDSIDFVIDTDAVNYDLSDHYTPAAGNYTIYISPNVVIGSYSASSPAFTTGSQASGVSFTIINRGQILGMGGKGGNAALSFTPPSSVYGENGGDAFEATVHCQIDTSSGLIWAGGGGAGGQTYIPGYSSEYGTFYTPRNGGGGGQGFGSATGGFNSDGSSLTSVRAPAGNQSSAGINGTNNGGEWGTDSTGGISPGKSGLAIRTNGKTVTITAGDNEFNIRGQRI